MKKILGIILALAMVAVSAAPAFAIETPPPSITPSSIEEIIFPGGSFEVEKTVQTPAIPPKLDFLLIVDLSGSYGDDLPVIKGLAPGLFDNIVASGSDVQFGLASFVDYPFPPWGSAGSGDYAYQVDQHFTTDKTTWTGAVNGMIVRFGGDEPESQYEALYQAATGTGRDVPPLGPSLGDIAPVPLSWRADATKVIAITTDASFHNAGDSGPIPYPGPSRDDTVAALNAEGIAVIAIKAPGSGAQMDDIAAATGGSVQTTGSSSTEIADAILAGLTSLPITVSMASNASYPLATTFSPESQVVTSGSVAVFIETITVAADAPGGTYFARDWALIDGVPMTDAEGNIIYETKTIHVPEGFLTGGGQITTGKGKDVNKVTYAGNVGFLADFSLVGQWQMTLHNVTNDPVGGSADSLDGAKFHSTAITFLAFNKDASGGPEPPQANANSAFFTADGTLNGEDGWMLRVAVFDRGEPGVADSVGFTLWNPEGTMVYYQRDDFPSDFEIYGFLTTRAAGNLQIHSGVR